MNRADELRTLAAEMDSYANAVIEALAGDFPDLRDPMIAGIVRKAVYVNARGSSRVGFEVIVDDPFTANWRLVARGDRRRVRLACWQVNPSEADRERLQRLNAVLDGIAPDGEGER